MDLESAESQDGSHIRRACDQCRLRKIRCDKETPCSNCRSAKRTCSSTGVGQKPKEPRQRVLISSQYERKIDQIEERLASIEMLLQRLVPPSGTGTLSVPGMTPSSDASAPRHTSEPSPYPRAQAEKLGGGGGGTPSSSTHARAGMGIDAAETASGAIFDPEDDDAFEGNSSMTAHTAFASEFLTNAIRRTSLDGPGSFAALDLDLDLSPKMETALSSLRQIVGMQREGRKRRLEGAAEETRWPSQKQVPRTRLRDLPLPPMAIVAEKVREMNHGPVPVMLAIIYTFTDINDFVNRCRQIYFHTEEGDLSEATFIITNAGLTYLFFEAALSAESAEEKAKFMQYREMCRRNLEIALAQLNMMMPATGENVEALLMGASFCIEFSRASLAWLLVSRAAHMCRILGWHQAQTMVNDSPQQKADKSLLFWCTYMLDKALSLRLGRASVFQDYDISLPHIIPEAKAAYPGQEVMTLWIKQARVLGRIYERLYSPGALRQPDAVRIDMVRTLAREQEGLLSQCLRLLREFEASTDPEGRLFALTLKSDEVSYKSSLALTYRAMPPNGTRSRTFSDECIDMARASMEAHGEAMAMMDNESLKIVYIHWTILYAPFIPFIVIFCLVLESSDMTDLQRLADFVASLETASDISPSTAKLYQLCQALYNVASLYVEAKAQRPIDQGMVPVGNEFDMYLSQLGFMPIDETMGGTGLDMGVDDQSRSMTQALQLGDWFSGNNMMMGLLEEDLSGINPSGLHS
ncbi:fungal-specific transcription factor domain protein [Xylariaceae sp. FL0016]|nr:fungal-specific transcription factor domain protein [Xylariaceae sp. FL0016]